MGIEQPLKTSDLAIKRVERDWINPYNPRIVKKKFAYTVALPKKTDYFLKNASWGNAKTLPIIYNLPYWSFKRVGSYALCVRETRSDANVYFMPGKLKDIDQEYIGNTEFKKSNISKITSLVVDIDIRTRHPRTGKRQRIFLDIAEDIAHFYGMLVQEAEGQGLKIWHSAVNSGSGIQIYFNIDGYNPNGSKEERAFAKDIYKDLKRLIRHLIKGVQETMLTQAIEDPTTFSDSIAYDRWSRKVNLSTLREEEVAFLAEVDDNYNWQTPFSRIPGTWNPKSQAWAQLLESPNPHQPRLNFSLIRETLAHLRPKFEVRTSKKGPFTKRKRAKLKKPATGNYADTADKRVYDLLRLLSIHTRKNGPGIRNKTYQRVIKQMVQAEWTDEKMEATLAQWDTQDIYYFTGLSSIRKEIAAAKKQMDNLENGYRATDLTLLEDFDEETIQEAHPNLRTLTKKESDTTLQKLKRKIDKARLETRAATLVLKNEKTLHETSTLVNKSTASVSRYLAKAISTTHGTKRKTLTKLTPRNKKTVLENSRRELKNLYSQLIEIIDTKKKEAEQRAEEVIEFSYPTSQTKKANVEIPSLNHLLIDTEILEE